MDEAQKCLNAPERKVILQNISRRTHTRLRYPGGPTRVPKNGNAVRYPGRPYDPPGYAMTSWRLCARATRVNKHLENNMAVMNTNLFTTGGGGRCKGKQKMRSSKMGNGTWIHHYHGGMWNFLFTTFAAWQLKLFWSYDLMSTSGCQSPLEVQPSSHSVWLTDLTHRWYAPGFHWRKPQWQIWWS